MFHARSASRTVISENGAKNERLHLGLRLSPEEAAKLVYEHHITQNPLSTLPKSIDNFLLDPRYLDDKGREREMLPTVSHDNPTYGIPLDFSEMMRTDAERRFPSPRHQTSYMLYPSSGEAHMEFREGTVIQAIKSLPQCYVCKSLRPVAAKNKKRNADMWAHRSRMNQLEKAVGQAAWTSEMVQRKRATRASDREVEKTTNQAPVSARERKPPRRFGH